MCALSMSVGRTVAGATEGTHDFARYQIILDRVPFGQVVVGGPDSQQPPFATRFTFVGTAQLGPDQPLLAIIMDKEGNHVHFKAEGDTIGSISIVTIEKTDRGTTQLVIKQGLEVATLVLEPKAAGGGPPPGSPAAGGRPGQPPTPQPIQPGLRRIPFRRGG
jgi:hypothetical protein